MRQLLYADVAHAEFVTEGWPLLPLTARPQGEAGGSSGSGSSNSSGTAGTAGSSSSSSGDRRLEGLPAYARDLTLIVLGSAEGGLPEAGGLS